MSASFDRKLNVGLLLDLQFKEGTGTITQDWSKTAHHPTSLVNTPTWTTYNGFQVLTFDAASFEYAQVLNADSVDCDFTTGDFTCGQWFRSHNDSPFDYFICRGSYVSDGWMWQINGSYYLLETAKAGPQVVVTQSLPLYATGNIWRCAFATRRGTSVRIYVNGVDKTDPANTGVHSDIITSPAENLHFGVYDNAGSAYSDGDMWRPRIWNRALTPEEIYYIWQTERRRFNV